MWVGATVKDYALQDHVRLRASLKDCALKDYVRVRTRVCREGRGEGAAEWGSNW